MPSESDQVAASKWEARYLAVQAFLGESSERYPLRDHVEDPERSLGRWVEKQRQARQVLGPLRQAQLEQLPAWQWGAPEPAPPHHTLTSSNTWIFPGTRVDMAVQGRYRALVFAPSAKLTPEQTAYINRRVDDIMARDGRVKKGDARAVVRRFRKAAGATAVVVRNARLKAEAAAHATARAKRALHLDQVNKNKNKKSKRRCAHGQRTSSACDRCAVVALQRRLDNEISNLGLDAEQV